MRPRNCDVMSRHSCLFLVWVTKFAIAVARAFVWLEHWCVLYGAKRHAYFPVLGANGKCVLSILPRPLVLLIFCMVTSGAYHVGILGRRLL